MCFCLYINYHCPSFCRIATRKDKVFSKIVSFLSYISLPARVLPEHWPSIRRATNKENFFKRNIFYFYHTSLFKSRCSSFFFSSCSLISDLIASASMCKTDGSRFLGSADELQPWKFEIYFNISKLKFTLSKV